MKNANKDYKNKLRYYYSTNKDYANKVLQPKFPFQKESIERETHMIEFMRKMSSTNSKKKEGN